ncbi:hypothetical protein J699_02973 [Acinetobacter sp. 1000160]|nr:hypothetical protein J522_3080 [Acinetobacter baumannii 146457]EYT16999.1 hypothetical protein J699_02973 [Acinetobacter sp. 1000160]
MTVRVQEINNGPAKTREGKLNQNGILRSLDHCFKAWEIFQIERLYLPVPFLNFKSQ